MTNGIKLHILPTGAMHMDLSWLLLGPQVMAHRGDTAKKASWVEVPTHSVLIDHPDGKLLWDTGPPRNWEERWAPTGLTDFLPADAVAENMWLDSRLEQLGLVPEDIDYLLLGPHIKLDYDGLPFETVEGDTEILPGVTLIQAPGHTWGTMALRVDLPDSGTVLFASDAVFLEENYGPPATGAALIQDSVKWFASVEKIRSIASSTDATIVFGHDAKQLTTLKLTPDYYT
jgi:N-acyl homoserine lactone hydrolase